MVKIRFHVYVMDKMELILDSETGRIESAIFNEPWQAKSLKVYDGAVLRNEDVGEADITQIILLARTFWELGGVKIDIVKLKLSEDDSYVKRLQLTEKDEVDSVMWGIH